MNDHLSGEKNGKIVGKMLFIVPIDVEEENIKDEANFNYFPKPII